MKQLLSVVVLLVTIFCDVCRAHELNFINVRASRVASTIGVETKVFRREDDTIHYTVSRSK